MISTFVSVSPVNHAAAPGNMIEVNENTKSRRLVNEVPVILAFPL